MSFRRFTPPDARSTRRGRSQLLGGTRRRTTLTIAALLAICYTLLTWPAAAAPLPGLHLEPRAAQLEERRYACIQGQCNVCRFGAGHLRGREALESEKSQQRVNGTFVSAAQLSAEGVRFLQVGGDWWNKCGDGWLNADMVFTRLPSGVVCEDWRTGRLIMRLVAGQGLPFADGSFDAVYSEHMFEHILPRDGNSTPLPRHFLVVARAMAAAPGPEPLLHFSFSQPVHPRSTSPRPPCRASQARPSSRRRTACCARAALLALDAEHIGKEYLSNSRRGTRVIQPHSTAAVLSGRQASSESRRPTWTSTCGATSTARPTPSCRSTRGDGPPTEGLGREPRRQHPETARERPR